MVAELLIGIGLFTLGALVVVLFPFLQVLVFWFIGQVVCWQFWLLEHLNDKTKDTEQITRKQDIQRKKREFEESWQRITQDFNR